MGILKGHGIFNWWGQAKRSKKSKLWKLIAWSLIPTCYSWSTAMWTASATHLYHLGDLHHHAFPARMALNLLKPWTQTHLSSPKLFPMGILWEQHNSNYGNTQFKLSFVSREKARAGSSAVPLWSQHAGGWDRRIAIGFWPAQAAYCIQGKPGVHRETLLQNK